MKNLFRTGLVVLVLSLMSLSVYAIGDKDDTAGSLSSLKALSAVMPEDTGMYIAMRIDDLFLDNLDVVYQHIIEQLPNHMVPSRASLIEQLTPILEQDLGIPLDTLRAWSGDVMALGFSYLTNDIPLLLYAMEVTDYTAAEQFIRDFMNTMSESTINDALVFTNREISVLLSETHLMITAPIVGSRAAPVEDLPMLNDTITTLDTAAAFHNGVDTLPESAYDMIFYFNSNIINSPYIRSNVDGIDELLEPMVMPIDFSGTMGLTIQDDRVLVMDMAYYYASETEITEAYLQGASTDILSYMPADTGMFVLGRALNESYPMVRAALLQADDTDGADVGAMLTFLERTFQIYTGLNFQSEFMDVLTGEFAIYIDLDADAIYGLMDSQFTSLSLPLDFGMVARASSAEDANNVVQGMDKFFDSLNKNRTALDYETRTVNGVDVKVVTLALDPLEPIQIAAAAIDDYLMLGIWGAIEPVLWGDTLDDDTVFQQTQSYMLPDSYSLMYTDNDGAVLIAFMLFALDLPTDDLFDSIQAGPGFISNAQQSSSTDDMRAIADLVESTSLSVRYFSTNAFAMRITLSIVE